MISLVTTPTHEWLEEQVSGCRKRFVVACPYVGSYFANLSKRLSKDVTRVLVTRTDLRDFAKGASDIEAVCESARLGACVMSLPRLHAKVYIIDNRAALVTSANATYSGMRRNWECGIALTDEREISQLTKLVDKGFGATEQPQRWTLSELESLKEPVRVLRESLPPSVPTLTTGMEDHPKLVLSRRHWMQLNTGLPGWMRLTLEGVAGQLRDEFDIHDVYHICLPLVARRYPSNKFPREKLRQQLQRLRDLGMIEFLGEGRYRRTVKAQN
jgi:phosphatidylserine/phosphatidylglycerophosphate/cardiolipin synthase-like enzyme